MSENSALEVRAKFGFDVARKALLIVAACLLEEAFEILLDDPV